MAELVKVVVDAMGGDYAPVEPVKAAVEAVKERVFFLSDGKYRRLRRLDHLCGIYHLNPVLRIILIFIKLPADHIFYTR